MRHYHYILEDKQPVPMDDVVQWAKWRETHDHTVKKTRVGDYLVSTVFLSVEHGFDDNGSPLLFETMVFLDGEDVFMVRAVDWHRALFNHDQEVKALQLLY